MIGRNVPLKRELIEQSSLFDLPVSHHDLQSCFSQRLNQRISSRATTDFFNTIGHERTSTKSLASLGEVDDVSHIMAEDHWPQRLRSQDEHHSKSAPHG